MTRVSGPFALAFKNPCGMLRLHSAWDWRSLRTSCAKSTKLHLSLQSPKHPPIALAPMSSVKDAEPMVFKCPLAAWSRSFAYPSEKKRQLRKPGIDPKPQPRLEIHQTSVAATPNRGKASQSGPMRGAGTSLGSILAPVIMGRTRF